MTTLIARTQELHRLEKIYRSQQAELVAVYGRRLVGKTFLIRKAYTHKGVYFEFSGIHNAILKTQLINFSIALADTFYDNDTPPICNSWFEAITLLKNVISKLNTKDRIVLFIDELPWLATPKSGALSAIEHLWNRYLCDDPRILMVLCGSAAAWMIQKVIQNRGGLHGRLTQQIKLLPFNLKESDNYLSSKNIQIDRKQLTELYFVFGGIPKYLSYIERGKSIAQNINDICFVKTGAMAGEFTSIFHALFKNAQKHIQIITALAKYPKGLIQKKLLAAVNIPSGGTASRILQELVESGFILEIRNFGKNVHERVYKLIDEYSLFYLTWLKEIHQTELSSQDTEYWQKIMSTQRWKSCSNSPELKQPRRHGPKKVSKKIVFVDI